MAKALTMSELDAAIASERAPAQKRGDRLAEIAKALLAGPSPAEREKLDAERAGLLQQKHARSERLTELLAQRRALARSARDKQTAADGDMGDLSTVTDEQLLAMHAQFKDEARRAHAQMRSLALEISRRQSHAASRQRIVKLSAEQLRVEQLEIDRRIKELDAGGNG